MRIKIEGYSDDINNERNSMKQEGVENNLTMNLGIVNV